MDTIAEGFAANLKRINALLTWWGMPNVTGVGATMEQMKRLQKLAADLQAVCCETSQLQVKTFVAANEEMVRAFSAMLRIRAPKDLLGAESKVIADLSEGLSLQTKTWADMSEKVHEFARQTAEEIKRQDKDAAAKAA